MKTRVAEMLGIKYPILQGGMQWVGRAEFVSAVSNAGGIGFITALTQPTPNDLLREIERTRSMTDHHAVSDEVVMTERWQEGCQFDDIRPLVAGVRARAALAASYF